tara:strand:+ start:1170 stop:2216 length:1047 start_codon:yes stop_codon:yes gene_type:complete
VRKILARVVSALIRDHHDAFLVELMGPEASTVSPERIQELLSKGVLDPAHVGRVKIPVGDETLDPYAYLRLLGRAYDRMSEEDALAARTWGLAEWAPHVQRELAEAKEQMGLELGGRVVVGTERPELPAVADAAGVEPDAPEWLSPHESASYKEAVSRAGAYARGLGNVYAEDLSTKIAETWEGEQLVVEGDPDQRAMMREIIREKTADAVLTHQDQEKLARDLAEATGYYSHNWRRIAATELQGAHNLGIVEAGIDQYGEDARVARITESGACPHCLRLFRDSDDLPRIFSVRELLENGTNVGKRAADWQPTAWPVHPNCRCDTRVVPPGRVVTADGRIRLAKEAAA